MGLDSFKDNEYAIADLHFGHKMLVELYRHFETIENMDEAIIANWNNIISKQDTVWVLGDCSFYNKEKTIKIIRRLKGNKNLILGNHDRQRSAKWWLSVGFNEVYKYPIVKGNYILSHEPQTQFYGLNNIHGHLHARENILTCNYRCVSAELINYTPVSLKSF